MFAQTAETTWPSRPHCLRSHSNRHIICCISSRLICRTDMQESSRCFVCRCTKPSLVLVYIVHLVNSGSHVLFGSHSCVWSQRRSLDNLVGTIVSCRTRSMVSSVTACTCSCRHSIMANMQSSTSCSCHRLLPSKSNVSIARLTFQVRHFLE